MNISVKYATILSLPSMLKVHFTGLLLNLLTPAFQTYGQAISNNQPRQMLRVMRGTVPRFLWLRDGRQGSYQTAEEMAKLVREGATKDVGLQDFAVHKILGPEYLDSHSDADDIIDAVFRYTQKLKYISDTTGQGSFDAVQSARDTIESGYGDCDDLSVALATLLAVVGFRPAFVLAKMREDSNGFDHVYVEVNGKRGRIALDPTSRSHGMGWESPKAIERRSYPIFARNGMPGASGLGFLSLVGAAAPAFAVPVWGQIALGATALIGPLMKLLGFGGGPSAADRKIGSDWDAADKQVAAFLTTLNTKATAGTLTIDDYSQAVNVVQQLFDLAEQQKNVAYVVKQSKMELPTYQSWLAALAAHVPPPPTDLGSPASGGTVTTGSGSTSMLGSVSNSSLPVVALIALGALLLLKR